MLLLVAAARPAAGGRVLYARHCAAVVCALEQLPLLCVHLVWLAATAGESFLTTEDACMTVCRLQSQGQTVLADTEAQASNEYMGSVLAQYLGQTF
jgi:hypothetical protein